MKNPRLYGGACACLLVLLGLNTASHASTVSYTTNFSGATDFTNHLINVAQFDPSLGTLVSATFDLSATMTTQASAINDGDFYVGWDKTSYDLSLQGDTGYSSLAISDSNAPIRIAGTGTPDGTFAFTSEYLHVVTNINPSTWTMAGPTLNPSNTFVESPLAAYIGTGDLSFFLTTLNYDYFATAGSQTGGLPSPNTAGISTNVLAQVKVTYEYNAVPIPAAAWLFGSGLMGLVVISRRKQSIGKM